MNPKDCAFPITIDIPGGSFNPYRNRMVPAGEVDRQVGTGLTVRDYIAIEAMKGILCGGKNYSTKDIDIVSTAYALADAMIAESEKK